MITISESEILDALRAAEVAEGDRPANTLTTVEIAESLGISVQRAGERIRAACRAGRLECVRVRVRGVDGVLRPLPAYRPVK